MRFEKLIINKNKTSDETIAMVPFKNLTILRKKYKNDQAKQTSPTTTARLEMLEQRKRMIVEHKDLFIALMRLSDKELQKKLLDVINNHHSIDNGTDSVELKVSEKKTNEGLKDNPSKSETNSSKLKPVVSISGEMKKKQRKRKVSLPQANKESRTKQLAKFNKPQKVNENISTRICKVEPDELNVPKRQRLDSFCISEYSSDFVNIYEDTETNYEKEIGQCSYPLDNGLLPIQDAVLRNQTNKLCMHISIWKAYKCIDLNDILTEEDEDLLQLAILNTCDPSIVNLLLEKGLNPNTLDADSNTVVHLAILNDITVPSLNHLMQHIDLKLLLTLNDDGYTPLHLAVRQDRYLMAECLINIMDERLKNTMLFKRPIDELETDEIVLKTQFKDYYENICLQLSVDDDADSCVVINHELKQKLLQTGDRRSGNTALYFALDNKYEHLIYFLLAHSTDPRTENLSGIDCKTYFSEFGKSLNLSLNIDITMDKVIKLLS